MNMNSSAYPFQIRSMEQYEMAYRMSVEQPEKFWASIAEHFHWMDVPFIYRIHEDPKEEKPEPAAVSAESPAARARCPCYQRPVPRLRHRAKARAWGKARC